MSPARLATLSAGAFLLAGLGFGVAKFQALRRSADGRAPLYVDIGHRAALLYAFAAIVVERLLSPTSLSPSLQYAAAGTALGLFALTIARYAQLALAGQATTQFAARGRLLDMGTVLLAVAEVGATAVLWWGSLTA